MGNRQLTYEHEVKQGNYTLPQPTFTLYPTKDPVADWVAFANQIKSSTFLKRHFNAVSKLQIKTIRPLLTISQTIPTAHWPQEELPKQFNSILKEWLGNVTFTGS